MLNEEKIKTMSRAAIFEHNHHQTALYAHGFYKRDYLLYHMLQTLFCVTGAFLTICVTVFLAVVEISPELIMKIDAEVVLISLGMIYIIILVVYLMISFFVYRARYDREEKEVKKYQGMLKTLDRFYRRESRLVREAQKQSAAEED